MGLLTSGRLAGAVEGIAVAGFGVEGLPEAEGAGTVPELPLSLGNSFAGKGDGLVAAVGSSCSLFAGAGVGCCWGLFSLLSLTSPSSTSAAGWLCAERAGLNSAAVGRRFPEATVGAGVLDSSFDSAVFPTC